MVKSQKPAHRLIFISYSSLDEMIVSPLAHLITAAGVDIFFARTTIPDGALWRPEIYRKLRAAFRVLVFWSANAASSSWVRREYRYAARHKVPVVPVLLDSTALPSELARYQALTDLAPAMQRALEAEQRMRAAQRAINPARGPLPHLPLEQDHRLTEYLRLLGQYNDLKSQVTEIVLTSPGT